MEKSNGEIQDLNNQISTLADEVQSLKDGYVAEIEEENKNLKEEFEQKYEARHKLLIGQHAKVLIDQRQDNKFQNERVE